MHTITVYPQRQPSSDDVKQFVQSFEEGHWVTEAGINRGVIESDDGRIYLDYDSRYQDYFDKYLDERQQAVLLDRLGFSPTVALHVQPSQAYQHSAELARTICEALVSKWGGAWGE